MAFCKVYVNKPLGVRGVAWLTDEYAATLHHHPEAEVYEIVAGTARLRIQDTELIVSAPFTAQIPPGAIHNLKPLSRYVLMKFSFPRGPLESIPYTWLSSRL